MMARWAIVLGLLARGANAAPKLPPATWVDWVGSLRLLFGMVVPMTPIDPVSEILPHEAE